MEPQEIMDLSRQIHELQASIARIERDIHASESELMHAAQRVLRPGIKSEQERRHAELARLRVERDHMWAMLSHLREQEQMAQLQEAVNEKVADPQVRQELSDLVAEFAKQQQQLARKLQAREDDAAKELRNLEVQERKWRMRKSLLDREPAAVLIGAVLLSAITLALIIATFVHTPVPDILANAFLLILGFFFGQTTSGSRGRQPEDTLD